MAILELLNTPGGVLGMSGSIGAIAYCIGKALNGLNEADRNLITTMEKNIKALETRDQEQQHVIDAQQETIERLMDEKNKETKKLELVLEILQNRSPELEQHLDDVKEKLVLILQFLAAEAKERPVSDSDVLLN
jgi:septal ring factor EnvC (AmiA/AmiB activator)